MARSNGSSSRRSGPRAAEVAILVTLLGVLAALSWTAAAESARSGAAAEAETQLGMLYRSSVAYFVAWPMDPASRGAPPRFPVSQAATPSIGTCCRATDGRCRPGGSGPGSYPIPEWDAPTWQALNYAIDDPHFLSYAYESSGVGRAATFAARAHGDLDCDGIASTFERTASADADLDVVGSPGVRSAQPTE